MEGRELSEEHHYFSRGDRHHTDRNKYSALIFTSFFMLLRNLKPFQRLFAHSGLCTAAPTHMHTLTTLEMLWTFCFGFNINYKQNLVVNCPRFVFTLSLLYDFIGYTKYIKCCLCYASILDDFTFQVYFCLLKFKEHLQVCLRMAQNDISEASLCHLEGSKV